MEVLESAPESGKINLFFEAINSDSCVQLELAILGHPELIDAPGFEGRTPLLEACHHGRTTMVELLLKFGSKAVFIPDVNGSLPIHWAAQEGHLGIIRLLLDAIPNPRQHVLMLNNWNRTPFWYACIMNCDPDVIQFLFDLAPEALHIVPKEVRPTNKESVRIISERGNSIIVEMIAFNKKNADFVLCLGVKAFGTEWIQASLDAIILQLSPAGPKDYFMIAARCSSAFLLELMLERFPDILTFRVKAVDESLAHHIIYYDNGELLSTFFRIGLKVEGPSWLISTLLQVGNTVDAQCILLKGLVGVHTANEHNRPGATVRQTILRHLEETRTLPIYDDARESIRDVILGKGNAGTNYEVGIPGMNILHVKSFDHVLEIVSVLVKWDGPAALWKALNRISAYGATPLHYNLELGTMEAVEFLLWLGSELIDIQAVPENAPLHIRRRKQISIFRLATNKEAVKRVIFLRAMGCIYDPNYEDEFAGRVLSSRIREALTRDLSEEEIMAIRCRVYFNRSLTARLLYFLP